MGSLSSGDMTFVIQFRLAYNMGWLAKDMAGKVSLRPNLEYSFYEKDNKRMSRQLVTELSKANSNPRYWKHVPGVGLRFKNLNAAFGQSASQKSRTLLLYSDVVSSNVVRDSKHLLIPEVHYRQDGRVWSTSNRHTFNGCPCVVSIWT